MNPIWSALDRLEDGDKWCKGASYVNGKRCILGAIGDLTGGNYLHAAYVYPEAVEMVANVISEQFPDRVPSCLAFDRAQPLSFCREFNDTKDTTWDDVRSVLEKAAVQYDAADFT